MAAIHPIVRTCNIEISNGSAVYNLTNPKVFTESGHVLTPPQSTIPITQSAKCSFNRDERTATGAVGVLTYQLSNIVTNNCSELLAIMYSVPFDENIYKNWVAVGIFEPTRACDKKLYHLMYSEHDPHFVRHEGNGSAVVYSGKDVQVKASMSGEGKATITVELQDKLG